MYTNSDGIVADDNGYEGCCFYLKCTNKDCRKKELKDG